MLKFKYFAHKIQDVKLKDYLSVFRMISAILLLPIFKDKYKGTWLICDTEMDARDNGYNFFSYMCHKHPERKCLFAIKKNSIDYPKIHSIGKTIEYGSIQHWIAYFLCEYNLSSQKKGKPNAAVCAFLELTGIFKPHNIYLKHGIVKDDQKWLYADRSVIDILITAAVPEAQFISEKFGYPRGVVQLTGLPRFDSLHDCKVIKNQIVIMPTWRAWLGDMPSERQKDIETDFEKTEYYLKWRELLESQKLKELSKKYHLRIIFYPHMNMQKHIQYFRGVGNHVLIATKKEYDIQVLLQTSCMMITDYSSVFFDMIYMKKPVIYYQFDEKTFRKYHYQEGWFDYHNNPFGNSFSNSQDVLCELEKIINNGFEVSKDYLIAHKKIFKYWDTNNCSRIYNLLTN